MDVGTLSWVGNLAVGALSLADSGRVIAGNQWECAGGSVLDLRRCPSFCLRLWILLLKSLIKFLIFARKALISLIMACICAISCMYC